MPLPSLSTSSKPKQFDLIFFAFSIALAINDVEPKTCYDAIKSPDANKWLSIMHDELKSLKK